MMAGKQSGPPQFGIRPCEDRKQIYDRKKAFERFDTGGDGYVSAHEYDGPPKMFKDLDKEGAIKRLKQQIRKADRNERQVKIGIYHHATLETDLSIHLIWDSDKTSRAGSKLGLMLAEVLKEFGMVDYAVWVAED
jgi:hypothetical protein